MNNKYRNNIDLTQEQRDLIYKATNLSLSSNIGFGEVMDRGRIVGHGIGVNTIGQIVSSKGWSVRRYNNGTCFDIEHNGNFIFYQELKEFDSIIELILFVNLKICEEIVRRV
jgi:hypothetical protein